MNNFFNTYRPLIRKSIRHYFQTKENESLVNNWQKVAFKKLGKLVLKGKLIRGSFVVLGSTINGKKPTDKVYKLAAALEIFHTAFLIHDDIMDQTEKRRGDWSMHYQFKKLATTQNLDNPDLFGQSMAINVGNIALFLSFELLNNLGLNKKIGQNINSLIASEMIKLGAAQMQDISLGSSDKQVTDKEILNLYKFKTARYSFVLPLKLGMILGNYQQPSIKIEELGELLGLIYQIKDDEINLFTSMKISGKSSHSDLKLKKKTFYYKALKDNLNKSDFLKLNSVMTNLQISLKDSKILISLIEKANIKDLVDKKIHSLSSKYLQILDSITLSPAMYKIFKELLDYSLSRQK